MSDQKDLVNYLNLEEAAGILSVSQDYLLLLIKSGKIKGFKIADLWFTSQKWIDELREEIKQQIEQELRDYQLTQNNQATSGKWIKLQPKKRIRPEFSYLKKINQDQGGQDRANSDHFFAWSNLPVVLSLILFLSVLGYTAILPVVNSNKAAVRVVGWLSHQIGGDAQQLYQAASIVVSETAIFKAPISDEAITKKWQEFITQKAADRGGKVAGEQAQSGL